MPDSVRIHSFPENESESALGLSPVGPSGVPVGVLMLLADQWSRTHCCRWPFGVHQVTEAPRGCPSD